jgi:hypothetical protein
VIAATEKLRQATVVKFRTVFIDKDNRVWVLHSRIK